MKLIPFFRFGGGHHEGEEDDLINSLPSELIEPVEEEEEEPAEEEKPEEEKPAEQAEEKSWDNDADLLKAFTSVEEEFTDTSGLASQVDDISCAELLEELRALAPAFGVRVVAAAEDDGGPA